MSNWQEFERIVAHYKNELYLYCYKKLNYDQSLADETFNDVLKVLANKWEMLDKSGNIRAYIYRIADNCIKHNLSENYKYYSNNTSLENLVETQNFDKKCYDNYFDSALFDEEKYIEEVKTKLPEEYRELYRYRYIEKKTLQEISDLIDVPYSTIRLRLSKLEKLIRKQIKELFENF